MINLVLLILFLAVSLVFIFRSFPEDQFLMIIELTNYQIELKSSFVFVMGLLLIAFIAFIVYLISDFYNTYQLRGFKSKIKNYENSHSSLSDFIKSLYLRDVVSAQKNIKKLKKFLDKDSYLFRFLYLQNLMIQGDAKKLKSELLAMNNSYPNDVFILNSLGLECHKNADYKSSINYLEKSLTLDSKSINTFDVLLLNYQIAQEYEKLEQLIAQGIKKKIINKSDFMKERALNYLSLARSCYTKNDLKNYHKYSDLAYKSISNHQYIFNNMIKSLLIRKKESKALSLIIKNWDKLAHPKLREYLVSLLKRKSNKSKSQITYDLILRNSYNIESFIIFALVNKENSDLHDKTIKYLERASNIAKTKEVLELMLELKSKYYPDTDAEIIKLKKSITEVDTEYKYVCEECNAVQEHWQLVCNNCDSIDRINIKLQNINKLSLLDYSTINK